MTTSYHPVDWRPDPFGSVVGYGIELAYAENVTGTTQSVSTSGTAIQGCVIVVQPTTDVVWLEWQIAYQVGTATNAGALFASVYDITTATPGTLIMSAGSPVLSGQSGTWSKYVGCAGRFRIGPVASTRIFSLTGVVSNDTGTGLTASARNTGFAPSYLRAVAS